MSGWDGTNHTLFDHTLFDYEIPDKRVAEDDASMISTIQTLVLLLGVVAAVAVLAARLEVPAAILLVLTGVVLALVPGLPAVELSPGVVLLLVSPASPTIRRPNLSSRPSSSASL
jgi:type IV secretory pathway TrbD component